jgi:hypothetical protein
LPRDALGERHRYALECAPLCACCRVPGRERCRSAVRSAPGCPSTSVSGAVASGSTERCWVLSSRGSEKRISNAVAVVRSSRHEVGHGWTRASILACHPRALAKLPRCTALKCGHVPSPIKRPSPSVFPRLRPTTLRRKMDAGQAKRATGYVW